MPLTDIATITVEAAWANNPDDASPTWYTVPAVEQVQIGPRGRHYELDTVNPTRATIRIDNTDGLYSSGDTISGGTVAPDRPMRVRAAVPVTATTTTAPGKGAFGGQSFAAGPFGSFIAITTTTTSTVTTTYTLAKHTIESAPSRLDSGGFDYASSTFTTIDYQDALAARTLKSCYNEQTIYEAPTAYYPFSEVAGRTSVGDVIGGQVASLRAIYSAGNSLAPAYGLGATPFFGSTDTSTNLSLSPHFTSTTPDANYVAVLGSNGSGTFISGATWAIRFTFATTYSDSSGYFFYQSNRITTGVNAGNDAPLYMGIGLDGTLTWSFEGIGGSLAPLTSYNDGYAHTVQIIGNATNTRFWVDGTLIATDLPMTSGTFNKIGFLTVGGGISPKGYLVTSSPFHGQIGHVAIWNGSSPSDTTSYVSATKGFIGETANTRIGRLLNWSNFSGSTSLDSTCSTPLGAMACSGQTVLQQCQDAANAEDGLFYIKGDGTPRLRSRSSRYSLASVATFGSTTYPVETSQLEFSYDRQHVVNDAYVTRPDGPTLRVVNSTSVTAHRTRTANLTFSVNSDDQLLQAANWYVYRYANPVLRVGTISFRPFTTPGLATLACTLEPGDKITVNNLPSQAPASSMDFIIESIGHANIANSDWTVELSLSPWIAPVVIDDTSHYGYIDDYISNPTAYGVLIY
jgi:hypothetical protein